MENLTKILAVAGGGALGATFRYFLNILLGNLFPSFPFATFFINLSGSFLIGLVIAFSAEKVSLSDNFKLFLTVGLLGAYTTFSTFEAETYQIIQQKRLGMAFFYVFSSLLLGLLGVFFGIWCGKTGVKFFS